MKPLQFTVKNVRLLKDITIDFPVSGVVKVKAKNEKGKTTLINSFRDMITGNNTSNLSEGVKNGYSEGTFVLPSGETVIVREDLSEGKTGCRFTIVDASGNVKKKVSDVKDLFQFNAFTIEDLIEWGNTQEGRRKLRNIFLDILGDNVKSNVIKLESLENELYVKRTEANQEEITFRNVVEKAKPSLTDTVRNTALPRIEKEYQEAEKLYLESYKTIETQKQLLIPAQKENETLLLLDGQLKAKISQYSEKEIFYNKEIADLELRLEQKRKEKEDELDRIKKEGQDLRVRVKEQQDKCSSLESIDISALELDEKTKRDAMMKLKEEHDLAKASANVISNYNQQVRYHQEALDRWAKLDEEIKGVRKQKEDVVLNSECPIKDIRLVEDGIEINIDGKWLPFSKDYVSTSSLYYAGARICVTANKSLPIGLISRGESIDSERLKWFVQFANENDAIFIVERVEDGVDDVICEILEE